MALAYAAEMVRELSVDSPNQVCNMRLKFDENIDVRLAVFFAVPDTML